MRPASRGLAAVAAGALAGLAFEPYAWSFLLLPAVAVLWVVVRGTRGRRAFGLGLLFGLAFMGLLLPWIRVIGVDAWLGLTLLEALFYGLLGVLLGRVSTLPGAPLWGAGCWVAVELLRSLVPWGGFPWGRLSFATVDTPLAQAMPWAGPAGTTFLVALLGCVLGWALTDGRRRRPVAVAAVLGAVLLAALPSVLPSPGTGGEAPTVRVAAVQGNVPGKGMDAFAERRAVLDNHVEATLDLADRIEAGRTVRPDFVLWPENSTDIDPFADPTVHTDIQRAATAVGVPVLVGAMVGGSQPMDVFNQGIVWDPVTGPGERYSKTHPVPFGEYIPHRALLARVFERLDQIPRDMVPGTEPGLLDLAGTTVGDVICFEVAYDGLVHDVVQGGARMLVVQTNNATYMDTGQVEQQFAIARLRAVETGRWTVVVATNGVSGIIAPDGRVVERAPVRTRTVMEADIPLRSDLTPAVRLGGWLQGVLVALPLLAILASVVTDRRRRREQAAVVAAPAPDPAGSPR